MKSLKWGIFVISFCSWTNALAYNVYFSPADDLDEVVVHEIQKAKQKIDISIYTFRSENVVEALVQKIKDNPDFELRLLVRKVGLDTMTPFISPLERELKNRNALPTNIRFANITNHHKFMIIDDKTLLNTSGNFNSSKLAAGYDENLFVCSKTCPKLVKAFKSEFEYLFSHSNYLLLDDISPLKLNEIPANVSDWQDVALFTSENFNPIFNGDRHSFKLKKDLDHGFVEGHLIERILSAKKSIRVATGHLRSYVLAKALVEASRKGVDVELILDSQEYVSSFYQDIEEQEKTECVATGKTLENCVEVGFHFGRWLHENGVNVYFKYYMVFWDFIHAPQMHHKYMVVDDKVVYTGSYNWSKNAEFKTLENKAIIKNKRAVQSYLQNFDNLKKYGENQYDQLLSKWNDEDKEIRLVFPPMALTAPQIDHLRDVLKTKCTELFKAPVETIESETTAKSSVKKIRPDKHICKVK